MNIELDVNERSRSDYRIVVLGRSAEDGRWIELHCEIPETHTVTRKYNFLWWKWEKQVEVHECHAAAVKAIKNVKHVQEQDEWLDIEFQEIEVREQWGDHNYYACSNTIWENGKWR